MSIEDAALDGGCTQLIQADDTDCTVKTSAQKIHNKTLTGWKFLLILVTYHYIHKIKSTVWILIHTVTVKQYFKVNIV